MKYCPILRQKQPSKKESIVIIGIPVLLIGGTEIQTLSVVKVLIADGYDVIVCCYHEYVEEMVVQFEQVGASVKLLQLNRQKNILGLFYLTLKLIRFFRSWHADAIHIQYIAPGLIPIIAAKLARIPIVFSTVHIAGKLAYGLKAKVMLRTAAKFCSAFVCVSQGVEKFWFGSSMLFDFEKTPKNRKHFTIYNAVNINEITQAERVNTEVLKSDLGINEHFVIGIVGRLASQKGHTFLLDAIAEIKKHIPNIALVVIGDGPERIPLQLKADRLGLKASIFWLGSKSQKDVYSYYPMMDVFVMPSLYEGFGLTAVEAMAFGLPVVGSNVIGLSEVIEHEKTGLLVNAGDANALSRGLLQLLFDREMALQYGIEGKQRAKTLFSTATFEETMLHMYGRYLSQTEYVYAS